MQRALTAIASVTIFVFPTALFADEKPVTTLKDALELPTSFSMRLESFEPAVHRLAKQIQASLPMGSTLKFDIKVLGDDLKFEGLTRNQKIRDLRLQRQPLRNVLTALTQKVNGNLAVTDPADPQQKVVWVVGPDPDNAKRQVILISTRRMAVQRRYKLPAEFTRKKPSL